MPFFRKVEESARYREKVDTFLGYNHNLKISDGEFFDTENLTSDNSPVLSTRKKRSLVGSYQSPGGIISKTALAVVAGGKLYYNGADMSTYLTAVSISPGEKQLVSMGAYLCIFPDKIYFNTERPSDCGYMDNIRSFSGELSIALSDVNGEVFTPDHTGDTLPEDPQNGDTWLDTSKEPHAVMTYSITEKAWLPAPSSYVKLTASGIGRGFSEGDGVLIEGTEGYDGYNTITALGENFIVVYGVADEPKTENVNLTVSRKAPEMDFVTECGNRLWGCKYGVVGGETVNEIYCCALGDFKNWRRYLGVSTDSWAASVGSDGVFTGAVTHRGYPLFFKENCLHKVIPSGAGAHQIVTVNCRGVERGSFRSLAVVNEILFYKSAAGICVYDGSLPESISKAFGTEKYHNAVGGALGGKYYVSMENSAGEHDLFVYDLEKGFWLREDSTEALSFAEAGSELYFITPEGDIWAELGTFGTAETEIEWFAESGVIGFEQPDKQYLSRMNLRMALGEGASLDVYIRYDEEPEFEHVGHIETADLGTFTLPIRPRRCDHLYLRLEGTGDVKLFSRANILETGSDY